MVINHLLTGMILQVPVSTNLCLLAYPLVNDHIAIAGMYPFLIGNTSSKGPFSIAMLDCQGVILRFVCLVVGNFYKNPKRWFLMVMNPMVASQQPP